MRIALAYMLRRIADRLHDTNRTETVEVLDEYGICRCRISVVGDDQHGIETTYDLLPKGWNFQGEHFVGRSDPN